MSGIFSNIDPSVTSQQHNAILDTCCLSSYAGGRKFPDTPDSAQNKKSALLTQATIASPFSFYKAVSPLGRMKDNLKLTFASPRDGETDSCKTGCAPKIRPEIVWVPGSTGDQEDYPDISSLELELYSKYLLQEERSNFNSSILKRVSSPSQR